MPRLQSGPLLACLTQSCFQARLELFPAFLLRISTALHSRKVLLYRCRGLVMLALRIFQRRLGFLHRSLAAPKFLCRGGLFLLTLPFAAPPLLFKTGSGAAFRLLIELPRFGMFGFVRLCFSGPLGSD